MYNGNKIEEIIEKVKEINGFEEFNEMQKEAIKPEYESRNLIVASPTSSGKTLVAETYALNTIKNKRKRVLYLAPLKALASEHYNTFKRKYAEELDLKIGLSTGDLDSSAKHLENYHIIFLTYEKLDSLIRHKAPWLNTVNLVIIDEIHMLDSDRGPTLESVIVQLKTIVKDVCFLGLSATIPNAKEIADWLNAELIFSKYRPITLRKGIMLENTVYFDNNIRSDIEKLQNPIDSLISDILKKGKQALIFANTRKSAEMTARKISKLTKEFVTLRERNHFITAEEKLDIENATDFDSGLLELIKNGCAFHHAGVRSELRELIEDEFRNGKIKVIASTPTLAYGINVPAYCVIINSIYRHTEKGMKPIPVSEYHQMAGRAGRMGYDKEGNAILFAKDENDMENLFNRYVYADPEDIHSQLGNIPTLRMIMLGLITNDIIFDDSSLTEFFNNTFYAHQFSDRDELNYKIYKVLEELIKFDFVKIEKEQIKATDIGRRVSELYIDPLSAHNIITKLKILCNEDVSYKTHLMMLSNTYELKPYFKCPKNIEEKLYEELQLEYKELGLDINDLTEDWELVDKYFTMLILYDWIEEMSEQEIIDKFNILPGILHNKIYIAEWMAYAIGELAQILGYELQKKKANKLEIRIANGIKEDLLLLVELPGIGRIRARKLAMHKIRSVIEIRKTDPAILANILGIKVTSKLLDHLKIEHKLESHPNEENKKKVQKTLT